VAALLHETGKFVTNRSHHKHSWYLISNAEILGLRRDDIAIAAAVARYHRRSTPKSTHPEYMQLAREQRMVVSKLAALLRVADALDRGHWQQVCRFRVERRDQDFVVCVKGAGDLTLERRALVDKGDLFEDIFGLRVRLEEETGAAAGETKATGGE
jgi:exopolyphosphatase/guanosine-5'-triphosphate,3'-diphosphate pyrophosphatase